LSAHLVGSGVVILPYRTLRLLVRPTPIRVCCRRRIFRW